MTLATGSLIALVSVFIIFRIQLQRDRIRKTYEEITKMLDLQDDYPSMEELRIAIRNVLGSDDRKDSKLYRAIDRKHQQIKYNESVLRYTVNNGIHVLLSIGVIFVLYTFLLHFHNYFELFQVHRFRTLIVIFSLAVLVILNMLVYLIRCVLPQKEDYSWL
ncbi:hypothetical protein ACFL3J_02840 [Candidatus Omnitrophota bacterium]